MAEPTYSLHLSSRQARLLAEAIDAWGRLQSGQLDPVRDLAPPGTDYGHLESLLGSLQAVLYPHLRPGQSTLDYPGGKELFNLKKVIRQTLAVTERPLQPGDLSTVDYGSPLEAWWETEFRAAMYVLCGPEALAEPVIDFTQRKTRKGKSRNDRP